MSLSSRILIDLVFCLAKIILYIHKSINRETELLLQRYDSVSFLLEIANNKTLIKNHNNDTN